MLRVVDSARRFLADRFHGRGGPLAVTPEPKTGKLSRAFLHAGVELGYDVVDPNAEEQMGELGGRWFAGDPQPGHCRDSYTTAIA